MRKIALSFLMLMLSWMPLFATDIILESDVSEVTVGETFDIVINLDKKANQNLAIETISGIENFYILGESNRERYVNIGGEVELESTLLLTLQPKIIGQFTIGPVNATSSGTIIESNSVEINVVGSNNSIIQDDTRFQNNDSDILDIFEEINDDIYLKWYPIWIIVFFGIFYFIINKFLRKEIPTQEKEIIEESQSDVLISKLKKLKKNAAKGEKTHFYAGCNQIIREFLHLEGYKNAEKMTLKEIRNLDITNKKLLKLFETSYNREFDTQSDTVEQRKKLIDNFITELQI